MDKVSGYIIANNQGGYDVISKTSQNSNEKSIYTGTMLTNVNGIGNTNALIKEVYDSTYERLRSEIVA
jgi:hypothetical protein